MFQGSEFLLLIKEILCFGLIQILSDDQSVRNHQIPDFMQGRLSKILAGKQLLFRDPREISERKDILAFKTVSAADGEFEVGHRTAEELSYELELLWKRRTAYGVGGAAGKIAEVLTS